MALYRASPGDGVAWITGGSSGLGRELGLSLAREGYIVAASARGSDKLSLLAAEASDLKGRILSYPCDVTDREETARVVDTIESEAGPITLAVFCAGEYFPIAGDMLDIDSFIRTYQINLFGVIYGLVPVARRMYRRGGGHIVCVGSVSSYTGLPTAAAYGASKAALNRMAESLRFDFEKMNIRIQMMHPGSIDTPHAERNSFPMPPLMPAKDAAAAMIEGIRSSGFEVTFPRAFAWRLKMLRLLPKPLQFAILNRSTGWIDKKLEPPV
jgi:NAD(P)-dependent dehydrogenase (short-subunit alcohol dehydrogenase family)